MARASGSRNFTGSPEISCSAPQHPTLERSEAHYRRAIEVAREQQAPSLDLRASTSLARLWADRGDQQKAYDLLAPIFAWFTEGFSTRDLIDAKELLDQLR